MDILISFCNLRSTPGRPALGLLDADTLAFRVIELPQEVPQATGMMGLACSSRYVFAGLQVSGGAKAAFSPPGLLIFDRYDFKLLNRYVFDLVRDIHSFLLSKDETTLYVVSSGTDEVVEIRLEGTKVISEKVFWRPNPEGDRADIYHINTIHEWRGDIYVTGFGKKNIGEQWNDARNGFTFNINRGETLVSGIEHPHSMATVGESMAYCESRKRLLHFTGNEHSIELPGYARGLCTAEDKLFVGTSASRKKSKSTGMRNNLAGLGINGGDCTVSRISLESFEIEKTVSLRNYAEEIYELLPVEQTHLWPVYAHENFRPFEEAWVEEIHKALKELFEVVSADAIFILVDENEWENSGADLSDYHRLYFLERDGEYWSAPSDDETAIHELEQMRQEQGAHFIAFGWPSFWWFDHYTTFTKHLRTKFNCVLENDHLVIFDLQGQ